MFIHENSSLKLVQSYRVSDRTHKSLGATALRHVTASLDKRFTMLVFGSGRTQTSHQLCEQNFKQKRNPITRNQS